MYSINKFKVKVRDEECLTEFWHLKTVLYDFKRPFKFVNFTTKQNFDYIVNSVTKRIINFKILFIILFADL